MRLQTFPEDTFYGGYDVAWNGSEIVVVWTSNAYQPGCVVAARYRRDGSPIGRTTTIECAPRFLNSPPKLLWSGQAWQLFYYRQGLSWIELGADLSPRGNPIRLAPPEQEGAFGSVLLRDGVFYVGYTRKEPSAGWVSRAYYRTLGADDRRRGVIRK